MAAVVDLTKAKSNVIGILQASRTAYASTVDSSKRQYASDTEIADAILHIDGEICSLICNTLQHPYQTTFVNTSSALTRGASLPARNGMILKVTGMSGQSAVSVTDMDSTTDLISAAAHGFTTGQRIVFATSGVTGGGLTAGTDYYAIYVASGTFRVATNPFNAAAGTYIELTATEPESTTVSPSYIEQIKAVSADEVKEVVNNASLFKYDDSSNSLTPFYFIEGDVIYSTAFYSKVVYTDYTKTSTTQAPEPYFWGVVSGAVSRILKDGGDSEIAGYYSNIYEQHKAEIASHATVIPKFHIQQ